MLPAMADKISPPQPPPDAAATPHYHGHRERLRERFRNAGPDALSDYELLELALFAALPRRDTKPLAKSLLKTFGSFAEVIHAPKAGCARSLASAKRRSPRSSSWRPPPPALPKGR